MQESVRRLDGTADAANDATNDATNNDATNHDSNTFLVCIDVFRKQQSFSFRLIATSISGDQIDTVDHSL